VAVPYGVFFFRVAFVSIVAFKQYAQLDSWLHCPGWKLFSNNQGFVLATRPPVYPGRKSLHIHRQVREPGKKYRGHLGTPQGSVLTGTRISRFLRREQAVLADLRDAFWGNSMAAGSSSAPLAGKFRLLQAAGKPSGAISPEWAITCAPLLSAPMYFSFSARKQEIHSASCLKIPKPWPRQLK